MIIKCQYPQKIYIEDEDTKTHIENIFGKNSGCKVGEWFDTKDTKNIAYENNSQSSQNNSKITQIYEKIAKNGSKNDNFSIFCEKDDNFLPNNKEKKQPKIYIVKPLDTFDLVAKKLNITVDELKSFAKTKHLFVGQKIHIQKS